MRIAWHFCNIICDYSHFITMSARWTSSRNPLFIIILQKYFFKYYVSVERWDSLTRHIMLHSVMKMSWNFNLFYLKRGCWVEVMDNHNVIMSLSYSSKYRNTILTALTTNLIKQFFSFPIHYQNLIFSYIFISIKTFPWLVVGSWECSISWKKLQWVK